MAFTGMLADLVIRVGPAASVMPAPALPVSLTTDRQPSAPPAILP
jgi:hypothetical protein